MKYVINSIATCSSRIGSIKDIDRIPGLILETPLLLLYTKGGSVPHLTHEVLEKVTKDPQPLQIPISTVAHCKDAVAALNKGIADFIGLKEYLTFCTLHDPATPTPNGFNDKDTVSIWPRSGRIQLDADKYMDIIETFQPDMYQTLCDGDTNLNSSKKRIQKSVDRTSSLFKKCLERHQKSEVLKKSAVLGVVEGGYSIQAREKSAKEVGNSSVFGFVIDGLHNNGAEVEKMCFDQVKPIMEETLKLLPNEKFRVVYGCWNPEMVLSLVELGIDAFDSSYPYTVTERGGALVFQNKLGIAVTEHSGSNEKEPEVNYSSSETDVLREPDLKKKRLSKIAEETSLTNGVNDIQKPDSEHRQAHSHDKAKDDEIQNNSANRKYEIILSDDKYIGDFSPISRTCSCLTCQKHTRTYIHHLLETRELLGSVLLTIHNLHHYMEFFKGIREALKTNSLDDLRRNISKGARIV